MPHHILVKVQSFIFLTDFVILDCEVYLEVPIFIGIPFIHTECGIDINKGWRKCRMNNEDTTFNISRSI